MINKNRVHELLEAYKSNQIDRKGFDELHKYLLEGKSDGELDAYMQEVLNEMEVDDLQIDSNNIYNQIINHPEFKAKNLKNHSVKHRFLDRYWQLGAAAVLCLGIGLGLYRLYLSENNIQQEVTTVGAEIQPQVYDELQGPTLMLADGTTINLDSSENGVLSIQGSAEVVRSENGLVYNASRREEATSNISRNSIITPKGKQYQITLPDGTKVWLNAATTLTYPVHFGDEKRIVEINGEAYFDVVPDKEHPFIVKSNLQELEVLGTSFNISSYDEDTFVKTTLAEGKVQIKRYSSTNGQSSVVLKPGQQSTIIHGKPDIDVHSVDTEEVVSWRKGVFVFNNEEIKEVMKKVSRWYDVDVEYENGVDGKLIGGSIQRFDHIDKLMESLQATGLLNYKMEGGTIIITE